jgi:hypothetical protein
MIFLQAVLFLQAFTVGEKLTYTVKYGPVTAGSLTLTVAEIVPVQNDSAYHFVCELKSNPRYRFLFSVDDRLDSYARTRDLVTLRTEKRVHEGNYQQWLGADFYYQKGIVAYSDRSEFPLLPESRDILTLWFYFRALSVKVGDLFEVISHTDKKNYAFMVKVANAERITTPLGPFNCLVLKPDVRAKGIFGKGGELIVYLSTDDKKLPVIIRSKMFLGYLSATLCSIQ